MFAAQKSAEGIVGGNTEGPNGMKWQLARRPRHGQAAEDSAELAFDTEGKGEARTDCAEGTEATAARADVESPALPGPSMEQVVERDNLREGADAGQAQQGRPASTR